MIPKIHVKRLPGLVKYSKGLELQNILVKSRIKCQQPSVQNTNSLLSHSSQLDQFLNSTSPAIDILLLLEHLPVYTAGRRMKGSELDLGRNLVSKTGADFHEVE